jgi:hypothetical protein
MLLNPDLPLNAMNMGPVIDICLGNKVLALTQRNSSFVLRVFKYDDFILDPSAPEHVTFLQENDRKEVMRLPQKIFPQFLDAFNVTIAGLKAVSSLAVGLTYFTSSDTQLTFSRGTLLQVLDRDPVNGWLNCQAGGKVGWIPQETVEVLIDTPQVRILLQHLHSNLKTDPSGKAILKGTALQRAREYEAKSAGLQKTTGTPLDGSGSFSSMTIPISQAFADSPRPGRPVSTLTGSNIGIPTFFEWAEKHFGLNMDNPATMRLKFGTLSKSGTLKAKAHDQQSMMKELVTRVKFVDVLS